MAYMYNNQGQLINTDTGQIVTDAQNPKNTLAMQAQRDRQVNNNTSITANKTGTIDNQNIQTSQPQTNQGVLDYLTKTKSDLDAMTEKYFNELRGEAQGDYNFAIKWLQKQHQTALGTNDVKRAEFFEKVADKLEAEIGRIPYDFFQKTEREQKDIADKLFQFNIEKEDQFRRQREFEQQQEFEQQLETEDRREGFNARGLADSGLELKKQQQQQQYRQMYKTDPFNRMQDLETNVRNFNIGRSQLESDRRLQDLTTSARRDGLDTQFGFDKGNEQAQLTLNQRLAELERQKQADLYANASEISFQEKQLLG